MKLAVSNIAWDEVYDDEMHLFLNMSSFHGLEIAPTRIYKENPYEKLHIAKKFADDLKKTYALEICSMQSIWYGRSENIFGNKLERKKLIDYTKKAIDFANIIKCNNLVFGCPRNRIIADQKQYGIAVDFFSEIGEYAYLKDTVVAIEANPTIYHTNFINTTAQALQLCREIKSDGIAVNLDCGTMIVNQESLNDIERNMNYIHHVHLSEPYLENLKQRKLHKDLCGILKSSNYKNFVSIEMKKYQDLSMIKGRMHYIQEIFV